MHALLYGMILDQDMTDILSLIDPEADSSAMVLSLAELIDTLHRDDRETILFPLTISVDGPVGITLVDVVYERRMPSRFLFLAIEVNESTVLIQRLWWALHEYED